MTTPTYTEWWTLTKTSPLAHLREPHTEPPRTACKMPILSDAKKVSEDENRERCIRCDRLKRKGKRK